MFYKQTGLFHLNREMTNHIQRTRFYWAWIQLCQIPGAIIFMINNKYGNRYYFGNIYMLLQRIWSDLRAAF